MNSNFEPKTKRFLCECGCGEEVSDFTRSFRWGHYTKTPEYKKLVVPKASEAKLGTVFSDEHRKHLSEAMVELWRDPEYRGMMSEALSGRVCSYEARENMSEAQYQKYVDDPTLAGRISEAESGENHWNWKGGFIRGYGYGWRAFSEYIKTRDSFTCQGCGAGGDLNLLEAHHIDGDVDNWDEKNYITVCHSCNMKAASKYEKEYWFGYYIKKIEEMYKEVAWQIRV